LISDKKIISALLFLVLFSPLSFRQIFNFSKLDSYKKIFVDTDDFGVSYLQNLEHALNKIERDTLQFEVLNELAYYWHTRRNLSTALEFTEKGLELTSEKQSLECTVSNYPGIYIVTTGKT